MPDDGPSWASLPPIPPPPSNPQAEHALLGALLANNRAFDKVAAFLRPEHFADPINGHIFAAIARRVEAGQAADAVTLKAELESDGTLAEVGGVAYLAQLITAMVSPGLAGDYGRAVRDCWVRREALDIAGAIEESARSGTGDPEHVVTDAVDRLLGLGERASAGLSAPITLGAAAGNAVRNADAAHRAEPGRGRLDTGIAPVDALWRGLWPGQLYYLAARSRTGKTPFAAQLARHVAAQLRDDTADGERPGHVHFFSLEMAADDLGLINLAATTRWDADQIRAGDIGSASDWAHLDAARAALATLPIVIDDAADLTIGALITRARVIHRTHRTRLILVDYRELIGRDQEHRRLDLKEWIPLLGYRLKGLAKALGVPVLALAQLNKGVDDGGEGARPQLRDLPYDGGQAADGVFALHRPELTMPDDAPPPVGRTEEAKAAARAAWHTNRDSVRGVAEFGVLKRRFGPAGWARLAFNGPRVTFSDPAAASESQSGLWDDPGA